MTRQIAILIGSIGLMFTLVSRQTADQRQIGALPGGAQFVSFVSNGVRGIAIVKSGSASAEQSKPVQLEFYRGPGQIEQKAVGYQRFQVSGAKAVGSAQVSGPAGSSFNFRDEWSLQGAVLQLSRTVRVSGTSSGGFLSAIMLSHPETHSRSAVEYFAPGMIYGSSAHLSANAIGGRETYATGEFGQVRIREDRLPAPLFGIRFRDGSALTVLDPAPNGQTTSADSRDTEIQTIIDEHFRFGAIGADLDGGHHSEGFWFPGSEGEVTYRGNTYPGGQVHEWRRRYHPIRDGFAQ